MPSKNKGKSKSRKGGKQRAAADQQQEKPNGNFQDDEDALLEEAIKLAAAEKEELDAEAAKKESEATEICCHHLYLSPQDRLITYDFVNMFRCGFGSAYSKSTGDSLRDVGDAVEAGLNPTKEKYPQVWEDRSKLKLVKAVMMSFATQEALDGNTQAARFLACGARYFEEWIPIAFRTRKRTSFVSFGPEKMSELLLADEHTLVKYLRKNIRCSCLDKLYEEVKSVTKMGCCCNDDCPLPGRLVERKAMMYCTRCRSSNYCSRECQEMDWPRHKIVCEKPHRSRDV